MKFPFWSPQVGTSEYGLVHSVLRSNYLNEGELTAKFEAKIASLLGCRHVVAVTSGTAAIYLSLKALGIGAGDEVIVPDITFVATANAVTMAGATPVLADVDPKTLTLDPESVRQAITPRTSAIIPVHISGRAARLTAIAKVAERHGLHVVEDAAEALMSRATSGRCLGTIAKLGCFSLSPNKTITTGQGGLIATNDGQLAARLRELKDQGRAARGTGGADDHPVVGFNFKFTNLQAAVGLGQLELLPRRIERMRAIYRRYQANLAGLKGVDLYGFRDAEVPQWIDVHCDRRDELVRYLAQFGAQCRPFWHPLHTQEPYHKSDGRFPVSSQMGPQSVWLPSSFTMSDSDVDEVCRLVRGFLDTSTRAAAA
jgi:perosamine synthetase